jgi:hypothetical protein
VILKALEEFYMTAGTLKKILEGVPDNAKVVYQRIEDAYFKEHGWDPVKIPGEKLNDFGNAVENTYDDYVNVWGCFMSGEFFCITAHY